MLNLNHLISLAFTAVLLLLIGSLQAIDPPKPYNGLKAPDKPYNSLKIHKCHSVWGDTNPNYRFVISGSIPDDYPGSIRYYDSTGMPFTYVEGFSKGDTLLIRVSE